MEEIVFQVDGPLDLGLTLGHLPRGAYDPRHLIDADGFWRATRTADGPATLNIRATEKGVRARAWGPGSVVAL
ncbi:MAG TPA: DNA-3-methyladenine glycosylase 2 family protein, partial [Actinomycetota bacterium]|nr:DNA-3-methyladenine glycosylase 2 family protein [Actinomycetota bacterium]